jgi:ribonuclease MRP protein subunit SNM1
MAIPAVSARLKYLNDSAHVLATASPRTSAYLMSQCNSIMFDNELDQSETQRRQVCGACGNIMVLGWTGTRQLQTTRTSRGKRSAKTYVEVAMGASTKVIIYSCELCGKHSRQNINNSLPRHSKTFNHQSSLKPLHTPSRVPPNQSEAPSSSTTPSSTLANANSRKRAKVRKQGGLQALLSKSRETSSRGSAGGFGLDLLDLMKKA